MVDKNSKQSGFALLLAIIVVGVVLSVGLAILDLAVTQVRLAASTRDSEIAFHAANAGVECALFWRRNDATEALIFDGKNVTGDTMTNINCFGGSPDDYPSGDVPVTVTSVSNSLPAVEQYKYEFSWPTGAPDRCTKVNMVVIADESSVSVSEDDISTLIRGHSFGAGKSCSAGSKCTLIAASGYNQPCPGSGNFGFGVIERKVLLEF